MFKAPVVWMSVTFFPARWGINQLRSGLSDVGRSGLIEVGRSIALHALAMSFVALAIILAAIIMKV